MTTRARLGAAFHTKWAAVLGALWVSIAHAQTEDPRYTSMSASVKTALSAVVRDRPVPRDASLTQSPAYAHWQQTMSARLARWLPGESQRQEILRTIYYEATRAGLDPQLVLSVIEVESGFRKYAISRADARGYMQIMPFWSKEIGSDGDNLFHVRTNLRYGCTILRHYLDIENGNLFRALARYNGSLGQARYPRRVKQAWQSHWLYEPPVNVAESAEHSVLGP